MGIPYVCNKIFCFNPFNNKFIQCAFLYSSTTAKSPSSSKAKGSTNQQTPKRKQGQSPKPKSPATKPSETLKSSPKKETNKASTIKSSPKKSVAEGSASKQRNGLGGNNDKSRECS